MVALPKDDTDVESKNFINVEGFGKANGLELKISAINCLTKSLLTKPPVTLNASGSPIFSRNPLAAPKRLKTIPSKTLRAICGLVWFRLNPIKDPRA